MPHGLVRPRTCITSTVATLALGLALSACGSSGSDKALTYDDSPLQKYLAPVYGTDVSPEEQQARADEQQKQVEEKVAACMSEEGFEYQPNTYSGPVLYASDSSSDGVNAWDPDSKDWVERYGYGMIHWPGQDDVPTAPVTEYVDPNADYLASLSESEQTAWNNTLYGAPVDDPNHVYSWQDGGCYGVAQHEVYGESQDVWSAAEFQPLLTAMNDMYNTESNAPELSALNADWASCMSDAGYPGFTVQYDAQNSISAELQSYYQETGNYGGGGIAVDGGVAISGAAPMAMKRAVGSTDDDPALAKIFDDEVAIALVDLDCRQKTDYRNEGFRIQFAIEEQFIQDHKSELDAFVAAGTQGR